MKYKVLFSLFGKKMQTEIDAPDEETAKYYIRGKVIFYKVEKLDDGTDFMNQFLRGFSND